MKTFFAWQPLVPPGKSPAPAWIRRTAFRGALIALGGALLQVSLGMHEGWLVFLPLVVSALLFGLPHGAIDHLVALGLAGRALKPGNLLAVAGLYLLLAVLYGGLWWLAPGLAIAGFLAMTLYHWGQADTTFDRIRDPGGVLTKSRLLRWTHTALRGCLPIGLPLLAFPEQSAAFLHSCLALFVEGQAPPVEHWRLWIGGLLSALLAGELCLLWRHRRADGGLCLVLETGLLLALFSLVPPLVAIGWYFCLWHGLRHVLRLTRYQAADSGPPETGARAFGLFFRRALPFTLLPLLFLALAGRGLPTEGSPARWIALYLVLISTLTFPHIILVEWMDRKTIDRRQHSR